MDRVVEDDAAAGRRLGGGSARLEEQVHEHLKDQDQPEDGQSIGPLPTA